MKFDFIKNEKLRKKFVDDYRLPIKIMDEQFFNYFLNLYWDDFKIEQKATNFQKAVDELGEKLQSEWFRIKDEIEKDISSQPKFEELRQLNIELKPHSIPNGNPYNQEDMKHICVSIDIRSANFNSLKLFDSSLVLGTGSFEELVGRYTDLQYFKESKIFRQLVFEPLLSKKQGQIQKKVIHETIAEIVGLITPLRIKTVSNDEIILLFDKKIETEESLVLKMGEMIEKLTHKDILKAEVFTVHHLVAKYFYKRFIDGSILLRNVPGAVYAQCFKQAKGLPVSDNDLLFVEGESGAIAKYITPLFGTN